mmetsp:Transcript_15619/g.61046  ORF Transcript_15619/g.61046 Transcript_15619/m.61046 type:complete len:239 (-) Transcript_15619:38-754(-)
MSTGIRKKKRGGKKPVDPFTRKDWYDIQAPAFFSTRKVGKTLVNRTAGTKIASDYLKGRVVTVCLADLQGNEDYAYSNIRLRVEEVQGRNCLTNFHGMTFTTDKVKSMVRKWQTLIECHIDVKTTDGYVLRLFCIGFTKKRQNQIKKTCYAQASQVRQIRKKMLDIMKREAECDLRTIVEKLKTNTIGETITKDCQGIYPLNNVNVRKVKMLKTPKYDPAKLLELHGEASSSGKKVKQ